MLTVPYPSELPSVLNELSTVLAILKSSSPTPIRDRMIRLLTPGTNNRLNAFQNRGLCQHWLSILSACRK
jgi:hypothetical protein